MPAAKASVRSSARNLEAYNPSRLRAISSVTVLPREGQSEPFNLIEVFELFPLSTPQCQRDECGSANLPFVVPFKVGCIRLTGSQWFNRGIAWHRYRESRAAASLSTTPIRDKGRSEILQNRHEDFFRIGGLEMRSRPRWQASQNLTQTSVQPAAYTRSNLHS